MRFIFYSVSVGLDFKRLGLGHEGVGVFLRNFGALKVHRL